MSIFIPIESSIDMKIRRKEILYHGFDEDVVVF